MKRLTGLILCGLLVAVAAVPADAMAAKRKGKVIKVEDSRHGPVLFDGKGRSIYLYVTDTRPGQITCQDVFEFGGTWYLVGPDGSAVT